MNPTQSVLSSQAEIAKTSEGSKTSEVRRSRLTANQWILIFSLLGIAGLGGVGVYALDPWLWRQADPEQNAIFHWEEAQKAMDDREFTLAREHLGKCLEKWPFNAEAHFLMARAWRREQGPTYPRHWQQHLIEAAQLQWPKEQIDFEIQLQQAQRGDVWSVEAQLKEALNTKSEPEIEMILEALAEGYLKNHRLAKLLELTEPWIERLPNDWLPHLYRGRLQSLEGTRAQAIEEYQTVLKLNPLHNGAQLLLASALVDDGKFKEALAVYERYLQENPGDANGLFGVANCQFSLGKTLPARAALKEIFTVKKDDVRATFLQAKIEWADDKPEEALKWLRKAEQLAPRETEITHTMIVVLQRLNKTEEAEKYIKRQKEILDLHDQLIKLRKQLRRDPSNVELRFQIGRINMVLGRDDEAYDWFQSVLRLEPRHAETLIALEEWRERNSEPTGSTPVFPGKN
jgi:tetratricopeptide (TPR) repeat protein